MSLGAVGLVVAGFTFSVSIEKGGRGGGGGGIRGFVCEPTDVVRMRFCDDFAVFRGVLWCKENVVRG